MIGDRCRHKSYCAFYRRIVTHYYSGSTGSVWMDTHEPGAVQYRVSIRTRLQLKCCEISFVHNIHCCCKVALKFCTEHGNITALICAKFQNDWVTDKWAISKLEFVRFWFLTCIQWTHEQNSVDVTYILYIFIVFCSRTLCIVFCQTL